jgi:hypothetical protein
MRLDFVSRRHLSITVLIAAVLSLAGVMTTTAQAVQRPSAQATTGRFLTFANKCVDVMGGSSSQGALIRQWTCNGTVAQNFTTTPVSGNIVTINTFNGLCVDVAGGHSEDGTAIRQWGCNGTVSQQFTMVPVSGNIFTIRTFANKCVDVSGGHTDDGTLIREWTCNNTVSQQFTAG